MMRKYFKDEFDGFHKKIKFKQLVKKISSSEMASLSA